MQDFFKDLTVIELASVLAGPAVGMFFAELGAKVIKIENSRSGGDVTRSWKLPEEDPAAPHSAYWCSVNWGKEVHFADLQSAEGQQFVRSLVQTADVVISNFRPASAKKMGMDYAALRSLRPSLIYAQISGFGEDDETPAYDIVLQAEAGFLHITGEPGRESVRMPVALIDLLAAHQLKEGILLALLQKAATGKGSLVKTSLLESAVASLANQATNWLMAGHLPQRMGTAHPNIAPYGEIFYGNDGKALVLAVGSDQQFRALCESLGMAELASDRRFLTNSARVKNRRALSRLLKPAFGRFSRQEWMEIFRKNSIPAGSIRNMEEVFELPLAKAMWLDDQLADGAVGRRVRSVAFKISD